MLKKRGRKPNREGYKLKELGEYLEEENHTKFARSIGISQPLLSLILKGKRQASLHLCNRILQETCLEVRLEDLRPDLYEEIMKYGEIIKEEV